MSKSKNEEHFAEKEGEVIRLSKHDLERLKFAVNGRCRVLELEPGRLERIAS